MPFDMSSLQEYIYSSERQSHFMKKYCDLFNGVFSNELVSFGYEKWNAAGFHMALSNTPRMAELYIETGAPIDQKLIVHPSNSSAICTFIQHDPHNVDDKYNQYRKELENHFDIRTTFCIIEKHLDLCQAFIWNFKVPDNRSTIQQEQIVTMNDIASKTSRLKHLLKAFKRELQPIVQQEELFMVNVKQAMPNYKATDHYLDEDIDYRTRISLLHKFTCIQECLGIKDLELTSHERQYLDLYLNNLKLTEIEKHTTTSLTDVRKILHNIRIKLDNILKDADLNDQISQLEEIGINLD